MTSARRVLRYVVPIDDDTHEIAGGKVLMVSPDRAQEHPARRLEVWVDTETVVTLSGLLATTVSYVRVHGTGQPLPADTGEHLASCIDGPLVWHLYRADDS